MATILRSADAATRSRVAAVRFDDLATQAEAHLARARAEAAEIVARARSEVDAICREAARAGCTAAMEEVENLVAANLAPALAALGEAAAELTRAKQRWLAHWETAAVRLAAAMAAKIIRRELSRQPDITLALVREALDLAAGSTNIRLWLHPEDYKLLGGHAKAAADALSSLGHVEVAPNASIGRGGCRVETRFGSIDQQIESQLRRIEEELIG